LPKRIGWEKNQGLAGRNSPQTPLPPRQYCEAGFLDEFLLKKGSSFVQQLRPD